MSSTTLPLATLPLAELRQCCKEEKCWFGWEYAIQATWVPPFECTVTQGQNGGSKKTDFYPSVISLRASTHIFQMFSDDNRRHYTVAWRKWLKHFVFSHTHLVQSSSLISIWALLLFAQTMHSTSPRIPQSLGISSLQYLFKDDKSTPHKTKNIINI